MPAVTEGWVERACKYLSALALGVMLGVVALDVVTRWVFHFSFEISDELAAYMLVAMTFLSLPVSHVHGAFHQVEFVQARLSQRARHASRVVFDLLALALGLVFLWQFVRLVMSSWRFGDRAPTFLETPLWLPRLMLVIGMAALCVSLCRTLAGHLRAVRHTGSGDRT